MRSSKSRSRSKPNRNNTPNRSMGNIINRVFDSSGPEGKVRGTPQQIIEKYNQLARDAQLSNDRVATENFQQHAEHYLRLLSAAQREMDQRREEQERQTRDRQVSDANRDNANRDGGSRDNANRDSGNRDSGNRDNRENGNRENGNRDSGNRDTRDNANRDQTQTRDQGHNRDRAPRPPRVPLDSFGAEEDGNPVVIDSGSGEQPDIVDFDTVSDSGLVETPEARAEGSPKPVSTATRKPRAPRKPVAERDADAAEPAKAPVKTAPKPATKPAAKAAPKAADPAADTPVADAAASVDNAAE